MCSIHHGFNLNEKPKNIWHLQIIYDKKEFFDKRQIGEEDYILWEWFQSFRIKLGIYSVELMVKYG